MLTIIKAGGRLVEDDSMRRHVLDLLDHFDGPAVLVHGGGPSATALSRRLGIEARMHEGRRITDADSLQVAVMVYAGWMNKRIVAELQARRRPALGLSGADLDFLRAQRRPPHPVDWGFVGDIEHVRVEAIQPLMGAGITPVICAITHDGTGQLLNTNADTIAAHIAIAFRQTRPLPVRLVFLFDRAGVLQDAQDERSLLPRLCRAEYERLQQAGAIHAGMKPKLHHAFAALQAGVDEVWLGNPASVAAGTATRLVPSSVPASTPMP